MNNEPDFIEKMANKYRHELITFIDQKALAQKINSYELIEKIMQNKSQILTTHDRREIVEFFAGGKFDLSPALREITQIFIDLTLQNILLKL